MNIDFGPKACATVWTGNDDDPYVCRNVCNVVSFRCSCSPSAGLMRSYYKSRPSHYICIDCACDDRSPIVRPFARVNVMGMAMHFVWDTRTEHCSLWYSGSRTNGSGADEKCTKTAPAAHALFQWAGSGAYAIGHRPYYMCSLRCTIAHAFLDFRISKRRQ